MMAMNRLIIIAKVKMIVKSVSENARFTKSMMINIYNICLKK